jgi:single-stranded-DNA-specific exonuclease
MTADAAADAFTVETSLTGRRWWLRQPDQDIVRHLRQRLQVPEIAARLLAARGVTAAAADDFLSPTLRRWLPDPHALKDMASGAGRLAQAIQAGERVAILADYDVDGATGAAVLTRFLRHAGLPARLYVPDRLNEGYGPSEAAIETLHGEGITLIVTIDCGVSAFAALARACALGIDVVVVDHHQAPPALPPAAAVINPNRRDESGQHGDLAAVGVAFLLIVAVNRALRQAGWYVSRDEPDLRQWLDLVALGTVCDMVPLRGLNRAFVRQGLAVAAQRVNPGLAALIDYLRLGAPPTVYQLGFVIGPRINAGGRVGKADLGARLLNSDDASEAAGLAAALDGFNRERQQIEKRTLEAALDGVAGDGGGGGSCIWAAGHDWHPGVLGIVASRLVDHYHKPAVVLSLRGGVATASARSVRGFDLGAAVRTASDAGLLIRGGGHTMAAGFSCEEPRLPALRAHFDAVFAEPAATDAGAAGRLDIDGVLNLSAVSPELARIIDGCGPFGAGNPEPRFGFANVMIERVATVASGVHKLTLTDDSGKRQRAVVFGHDRHPLARQLPGLAQRRCHLAARLRGAASGARLAIELQIDDAARADGVTPG